MHYPKFMSDSRRDHVAGENDMQITNIQPNPYDYIISLGCVCHTCLVAAEVDVRPAKNGQQNQVWERADAEHNIVFQ